MKRISYLFFFAFLFSILASSCSSTETYAELLDTQSSLINGYIKRNNIDVVSTFPTDTPWVKNGKKLYVYIPISGSGSGLYFHMVDPGVSITPDDTLKSGNTVVPRFIQYTLGVQADTVSNWNTIDYPYPSNFVYGTSSSSCTGFQEAAYYMKRNYSVADIIVPSQIGFSTELSSVIPMGYHIKIQILKE